MKLRKGQKVNVFALKLKCDVSSEDGVRMDQELGIETYEDCDDKYLQLSFQEDSDFDETKCNSVWCNLNTTQARILFSSIQTFLSNE
jgi:hypothetical protein